MYTRSGAARTNDAFGESSAAHDVALGEGRLRLQRGVELARSLRGQRRERREALQQKVCAEEKIMCFSTVPGPVPKIQREGLSVP